MEAMGKSLFVRVLHLEKLNGLIPEFPVQLCQVMCGISVCPRLEQLLWMLGLGKQDRDLSG